MKGTTSLGWRAFTLAVIFLFSALVLQGVHAQSTICYSCTDQGEGGCLPEHTMNVSCPPDYNVCLETISAIQTSHKTHTILKKGCGFGDSTSLDKTMSFHGISVFIQLHQCNSSLCNTNMEIQDYQLAPADNISHVPNDEQCYSCIGKTGSGCSPSSSPVMTCYNTYSYCFDGNFTLSIDNDTTTVPIKSCSTKYRCAVQTFTYGIANYEIIGACCSGEVCNQDLSNDIQFGDIPFLTLLNNDDNDIPETDASPIWLNSTPIEPLINVTSTEPQTNVTSTEPQTIVTSQEPQTIVTSKEPQTNFTSKEPQTNVTSTEPQTNFTSTEPQTDFTFTEPQTDVTSTEPQTDVTPTQPDTISNMLRDEVLHVSNSTIAARSSNYPLNADICLSYSSWVVLMLVLLL